jgi:hypothetical protein
LLSTFITLAASHYARYSINYVDLDTSLAAFQLI